MSNLFDSNSNNPYASSLVAPQQQPPSTPAEFPKFCIAMFVISLFFSVLRIASTGFSILGMYMLSQSATPSPLGVGAIWEVITGAGMVLSGIIGNSLMLFRKPAGLFFGYLLVFSALGSFLVAALQLVTFFDMQGMGATDSSQQASVIALVIGISVAILFRFALLGAYCLALRKFKQWCEVNG